MQKRYQLLVKYEEQNDEVEQLMREKAKLVKSTRELKEVVASLEDRNKMVSAKNNNGKGQQN